MHLNLLFDQISMRCTIYLSVNQSALKFTFSTSTYDGPIPCEKYCNLITKSTHGNVVKMGINLGVYGDGPFLLMQ